MLATKSPHGWSDIMETYHSLGLLRDLCHIGIEIVERVAAFLVVVS